MPIDTSIYGQLQAPQMPDFLGSMGKAMSLKQMQMQNQAQQLSFDQQDAIRQAVAHNVGPDGKLNQGQTLSDLYRFNPQGAMQMSEQFNKMNKDTAEADLKQNERAGASNASLGAIVDHLQGLPPEQSAQIYPHIREMAIKSGAIKASDAPEQYDPAFMANAHAGMMGSKQYLENRKTISDIGAAPAKLNAELYGSRSPNAELTSQYSKDAAPIRSSQMAMQQMYDNYNHPSPQGDASLVLNAFKIKFPTAPDVNSLEELSKSQAAPDQWKNMATKALQGGFDQGTRDNLMRDAASTYRANVESLKGIQERYQARAKQQNVNDPTLTYEPAVDKTYKQVMDLQDKIGPYVPPAQRPGFSNKILGSVGSMFGIGGGKTANAAPAPGPKHGAVEDGYVFMGGNPADPKSWKRAK